MEALTQPRKSSFADLLRPLEPFATQAETAPVVPLSSATATPGTPTPGSASSASGTVTAEQAFSGIKHTEISSISGSAIPGQSGTTPLNGATGGSSVSLGGMVQGEWAVTIIDSLLPAAIVAGFYAMDVKIRKSEMQLTEKEKSTIAPIMQKCLDSILLNFNNPWTALAITMGAIYGGKLMEKGLIAWIDKKQETQQDDVLQAKIAAADKVADPAKHDLANQSAADIQAGNIPLPGMPYSELDIRNRMKQGRCNRDKAIKFLNNKFGIK